jgi:hypothetical protein
MRSKHPLLTGHTRRAPLVEIRYTGLLVVKASLTNHSACGPVISCNRKQGQIATVEFAK